MRRNYIVTYATHQCQELDDDFTVVKVMARNERDAQIIMSNIEKLFDGVMIECEQEESPRIKKRVNSDRKKK